jgi:hypothetical protein
LALALKGRVLTSSNYRRIQRLLSEFAFCPEALTRMLLALLPSTNAAGVRIESSNHVLAGNEPTAVSCALPSSCACGFAPEADR